MACLSQTTGTTAGWPAKDQTTGTITVERGEKLVWLAGTERILEIEPTALHERCSVILGSPEEVERVTSRL